MPAYVGHKRTYADRKMYKKKPYVAKRKIKGRQSNLPWNRTALVKAIAYSEQRCTVDVDVKTQALLQDGFLRYSFVRMNFSP